MPRADRGEVWIVDLGMVAKVRPCLILSVPTDPQDRVLVSFVPHTTSVQGTRFEVACRRGSCKEQESLTLNRLRRFLKPNL